MISINIVRKIIVFVLMFVFFLLISLSYTEMEYSLYSLSSYIIVGLIAMLMKFFPKMNKRLIIISLFFILFIISVFITAFIQQDERFFINGINFVLIYTLFVILVPLQRSYGKLVLISSITGLFFLVVYSLIKNPTIVVPYQGVFKNPNYLGLISGILFLNFTLFTIYNFLDKRYFLFLVNFTLLALSFFIAILTSSRTSFILMFICVLLIIFLFPKLDYKKSNNKFYKNILLVSLFTLFSFTIYNLFGLNKVIQTSVLDKFFSYSQKEDLLNGRIYIWTQALEDINLFGNNYEYFNQNFNLGAHNYYIYILVVFGIVPFFFFMCFIIGVLKYTIDVIKQKNIERVQLTGILNMFFFLFSSLVESNSFNIVFYLFFLSIGLTLFNANKKAPI